MQKQISRCYIYNYHGHNYGVWNGGLQRSLKYRRRIRRDFSCCSSRIADYGTNRICFRIFRRWENCKDIGVYCYAPE